MLINLQKITLTVWIHLSELFYHFTESIIFATKVEQKKWFKKSVICEYKVDYVYRSQDFAKKVSFPRSRSKFNLKFPFRTFFYSKMWELIFEHKEAIFGLGNSFGNFFPTKKYG